MIGCFLFINFLFLSIFVMNISKEKQHPKSLGAAKVLFSFL